MMGFISSLLCGSSNSESGTREKNKSKDESSNKEKGRSRVKSGNGNMRGVSERGGTVQPTQSRIHSSLSNSTANMGAGQPNKRNAKVEKTGSDGTKSKIVGMGKKEGNCNNQESDSDAMDVDIDDEHKSKLKEDEKQMIRIYHDDMDDSTGTTPESVTTSVGAETANGTISKIVADECLSAERGTDSMQECTAVIRETENSSSADSEAANSRVASDIEMSNAFDDVDMIDLVELQPDQAHAPGVKTLLSPKQDAFSGKKCLILDLDETLVHSSFKYLRTADFVIPVEIENQVHNVYVIKRPGVDEFLKRVSEIYEVVVFTASVSRYGDPLLNILDKYGAIHHRLFRDSCYLYDGNYIKNLSQIGRPLSDMIILDNSPASYIFHPQHAIPISSWFSDAHDNELLDILPLLEDLAREGIPDVGKILDVTI